MVTKTISEYSQSFTIEIRNTIAVSKKDKPKGVTARTLVLFGDIKSNHWWYHPHASKYVLIEVNK